MTRSSIVTIFTLLLSSGWNGAAAAEPTAPAQLALTLNQRLARELPATRDEAAGRCNDETYLRRVTLDLVGRNPSIAEITAFGLDPDPAKRALSAARLLADKNYGENWANYWRDVIMYRRSHDRAQIANAALTSYLTEELNKNTSWDKLASSFITAEGDVTEDGRAAIFMAQEGRPEETVAEIARIFLGIQIQCAQCHDHPTDRWKREQFHELAAFFPRVAMRPSLDKTKRTFEIVASDNFARFNRPMNDNRFRGTAEHHMSDLEDPTATGKLMQPKFFVTGQTLKIGSTDEQRRAELARWLTSPDDEWFAKAIVNRLWSELVGEGFYEPVDDIGPDRECSAPETLALLSEQFVASGHDLKWLMLTIVSTDAYQQRSQQRRTPAEQPFTANVAQRLRADQIYNNLIAALDLPDTAGGAGRGPYAANRSARGNFNTIFGYDPSARRDEIASSIPQALAMMNSPAINGAINARGRTGLGQLLREVSDDRALITELYLKSLAREPSPSEVQTCLLYIKEVNNRAEAFEDLQWSLVNSTEFLHRK
ncbi:MAG TPA: DUF1549 domain-containing protein [Pirellulaceae bacterium]|nr:DUF1549 domain-containing protein [Pirellulaceae bacterium]